MSVTIDEMAARWNRREQERRSRSVARARTLTDRLPEAARVLKERYGARRVVLFGSLARGTPREESDVDLAVEGLVSEGFFTAIADLVGIFDCPVDLVEIEKASESLLARLRLEGREL